MKNIEINEDIKDLIAEEFKDLPDVDYRLVKIESFRKNGFVLPGDRVCGPLTFVSIQEGYGVKVFNGSGLDPSYIRTSPVVKIVDKTDTIITFETEGGVYKLERLEEEC